MFKIAGTREAPEKFTTFRSQKKIKMIKEHIIVDDTGADVGIVYPYRENWIISVYDRQPVTFASFSEANSYLKGMK
jgi:hypothetical protein